MAKILERAAQYREQAAALLGRSERAVDARQKAHLLEMASLYHQMAEQLEEMHRRRGEPSE